MKIPVLLTCVVLLATPSFAQRKTQRYGLPANALIVETQPVKANRILILWMVNPRKYPRDTSMGIYSCPEETRGSYYSGPARVSLVDPNTRRIINTLHIREDYRDEEGPDEFDLPYQIHSGSYYRVPGVPVGREGKPQIISLRDYNGDGKAMEFALFEAPACMGLQTALFGYSERRDKVIQYPIHIQRNEKGKRSNAVWYWIDYLFSGKPRQPGYWKYEVDYRGRGGSLDKYEIRYDAKAEKFTGTVAYIEGD
jgi:hypothetical protein